MKTKKSRQSCGLDKQLGTKKCSANPPAAKRPPFGRVLYSKAPSPKNTTGKVQTQTAVLDQRLPTKIPNKAAMVRLRNHSRASIPAIECARPIRDHVDQIEDSTIAVPKIATTRFQHKCAYESKKRDDPRVFLWSAPFSGRGLHRDVPPKKLIGKNRSCLIYKGISIGSQCDKFVVALG